MLDDTCGKGKRIAAAEDNVGQLGVLADIIYNGFKISGYLLIRTPYKPLAEAMPTVHEATICCQYKGTLCVFVLDTLTHSVRLLIARIKLSAHVRFKERGDAHSADRVVRVAPVNK